MKSSLVKQVAFAVAFLLMAACGSPKAEVVFGETSHPFLLQSPKVLELFNQGRWQKATFEAVQELREAERQVPLDLHIVAGRLRSLGFLLFIQGDFALAEPYLQKAMNILENRFAVDHSEVAWLRELMNILSQAKIQSSEPMPTFIDDEWTGQYHAGEGPSFVNLILSNQSRFFAESSDIHGNASLMIGRWTEKNHWIYFTPEAWGEELELVLMDMKKKYVQGEQVLQPGGLDAIFDEWGPDAEWVYLKGDQNRRDELRMEMEYFWQLIGVRKTH